MTRKGLHIALLELLILLLVTLFLFLWITGSFTPPPLRMPKRPIIVTAWMWEGCWAESVTEAAPWEGGEGNWICVA